MRFARTGAEWVGLVAVVAAAALTVGVAPSSAATKAQAKKPVAPITVLITHDDGVVHASAGRTASGLAATAVDGTPADSVNYAFDTLKLRPTVTFSGANIGQNLGPLLIRPAG